MVTQTQIVKSDNKLSAYPQVLALQLSHEYDGVIHINDGFVNIKYPLVSSLNFNYRNMISEEYIVENKNVHKFLISNRKKLRTNDHCLIKVLTNNHEQVQDYMCKNGYKFVGAKKVMSKKLSNQQFPVTCDEDSSSVIIEKRRLSVVSDGDFDGEVQYFKFYISLKGETVSYGKVVLTSEKIAYMYNMFTKTDYRGKGYATALINRIFKKLKSYVVKKIILIPSRMCEETGFYRKFRFEDERDILAFKKEALKN